MATTTTTATTMTPKGRDEGGATKVARRRQNRRAANGLGTVFQRSDDRWVAVLPADPRTGKRLRFTAKTQSEAIRKRDAAKRRLEDFGDLGDGAQTVEAFLRSWLDHTAKPRVKASTLASYRSKVETLIIPAIGKLKLSALRPLDVRRMMSGVVGGEWEARKDKRSPRTANYARIVLRKALDDALRDGVVVGMNAAAMADALPHQKPDLPVLSAAELSTLHTSLVDDPLRALLMFAASIGVRQGEALGLRWCDLSLSGEPTAAIRRQLQNVDGVRQLVDLKTTKSKRTLPLAPNLVALLKAHKAAQARQQLEAGDAWANALGLVFTDELGLPLADHRVRRGFQRALTKANLPRVRFHDLRHGALTLMLERGADLKAVSTTAGHSSIAITADTYAHVSQKTVGRTVALVDDIAAVP